MKKRTSKFLKAESAMTTEELNIVNTCQISLFSSCRITLHCDGKEILGASFPKRPKTNEEVITILRDLQKIVKRLSNLDPEKDFYL
jgi:hypothetical protein